jgi:hypothetical protein
VLIGIDVDEAVMTARLDACLLTDEEMKLGLEGWALLPDPFPGWSLEEDEDEDTEDGTGSFPPVITGELAALQADGAMS